jgi:hypothetical protein
VWYDGPPGASVVNGFTGKTVAAVTSPDGTQILGIAAARDDRTFVLYTGRRIYELRLEGSGKPQWLVAVAGTPPPAGTSLAVSPDARFAAYPTGTGVTVVSLATGATRSWAAGPDPSGAHLMASCGTSGIVNGTRFSAVNLHLADTSGITYSPFLAW